MGVYYIPGALYVIFPMLYIYLTVEEAGAQRA